MIEKIQYCFKKHMLSIYTQYWIIQEQVVVMEMSRLNRGLMW